jgi:hypothetical protein
VLVGLAPRDATGLDWNAGMAASNVQEFSTAAARREQLAAGLEERSRSIRADPARLLAELRPELPEADRRAVADAGIRSLLLRNYAEALRTSPYGWIDDAVALSADWGFALGDITAPVLFWHGEDDVLSPVAHSHWLAERGARSEVLVEPGAAHFGSLSALPASCAGPPAATPSPPPTAPDPPVERDGPGERQPGRRRGAGGHRVVRPEVVHDEPDAGHAREAQQHHTGHGEGVHGGFEAPAQRGVRAVRVGADSSHGGSSSRTGGAR